MVFESVEKLVSGATSTETSAPYHAVNTNSHAFQVIASGSGAVAATVVIEGTLDYNSGAWITLETLTVSGTDIASDGFISIGLWKSHRARVTSVGAGTTVDVLMST